MHEHDKNCNCGCRSTAFVAGYVNAGTRVVRAFNPDQPIIEEIIVVPPANGNGVLFVQYVVAAIATSANGDIITSETFSFLPVPKSDLWLTVNGLSIYPANGASEVSISAFYITDLTGTIVRPKGTYQIGDRFHWNGTIAKYQIETNDELKIIYEI
jgi:hypothetical protein